jgi:GrpB-like predicted nucleotidyltransferase (UPF0157 family)
VTTSARRPPIVVAYNPEWPQRAADLKESLWRALGNAAERVERIEHIGSTAIPGMAAKDVIDLQISVSDLGTVTASFDEPLGALGFVRLPYETDHVPVGRTDDQRLWEKRFWMRRDHPDGDVNLHVRRTNSPNERLALLFRDWFCSHADAIAAYASFKGALAVVVADTGTYADVKDPVVDLVITVAEVWAAEVGWQP